MKLAAQFVARNGSEFLNGLRAREETKREFFFLKDNHSLHTTFKRLTDAYSAVLLDSKEALVQLREDAADSAAVLQRYSFTAWSDQPFERRCSAQYLHEVSCIVKCTNHISDQGIHCLNLCLDVRGRTL
jgi:hypothetical protein